MWESFTEVSSYYFTDVISRAESGSDGSSAFGNTASGYGTQRSAQYGTADAYGGSTNTGPHSSDVANKLDPR
jgi:hypothetical protein